MKGFVLLFSFLARRSRDLYGARAMLALIVAGGIISGLASAAFIALINSALSDGGLKAGPLMWGFIGLCLLLPVSRFLSGALLLRVASRAICDLRIRLARRILAAPLRKLEELGPHRLLATLTDDVNAIIEALIPLPEFFMQLFIVTGCLAYLGWLSWQSLIGVVLFMVIGILTYQLPVYGAMKFLKRAREHSDRFFKGVQALTRGTKELKLHHARRQAFFTHAYEPDTRAIEKDSVRGRTILLAAACWGHILFFLMIGLILMGVTGQVEPQVATGYALVIVLMMAPLTGILNVVPVLMSAAVAIQKIERLGLSLESTSRETRLVDTASTVEDWKSLELADVSHSYRVEGEERAFTLGPIDLSVRPGELIFLIGGNGSGKTTLAKMLCGLYPPESGTVLFNGKPVSNENREAFRQYFTVTFSDAFVFDRLFGIEYLHLDQSARSYLEKLKLDKTVTVSDGKLSTVDVSQGQRKRLALLTAYLEDRPIYLFDEWAADQDPVFKEFFYLQLLPELKARGKTVIVISHDDRYFNVADRILKLEDGQLVVNDRVDVQLESVFGLREEELMPI